VGEEGEAVFTRITAERIYDLAGARSRFARAVRLSMNGEASTAGAAASAKLKSLLEPYRNGPCPVAVRYKTDGASVEMQLGDNWRVSLDEALMTSLRDWLKPENVEVLYP
jgi:DNA polymerase-3 subunit alpha